MWPVHTWLPDAHVEAPTGGSVVLAAIMLKLGAYGFLRFSLPIAPDASHKWAWLIIALSLIAVVYIGLVAMVQQDMKKLVAYSSIAHMGFVHARLLHVQRRWAWAASSRRARSCRWSRTASSRARCSSASACSTTASIRARSPPTAASPTRCRVFAAFAVLFAMANVGLPGTAGFVGEWMVILGGRGRRLLGRAAGRDDDDLGRGLHALDGQARVFRPGRQPPRRRTRRHQRVANSACSRCSPSPCSRWASIRSLSPT